MMERTFDFQHSPDIAEIKSRLSCLDAATHLNLTLKKVGKVYQGPHTGVHESSRGMCLTIYPDTDSIFCQHCKRGGDVIELIGLHLFGLGFDHRNPDQFKETKAEAMRLAGLPAPKLHAAPVVDIKQYQSEKSAIEEIYNYTRGGELKYQQVRFEGKEFRPRRPNGRGGWIGNLEGVERFLYRIDEVIAADPKMPVFIVEGEKDVDRLWKEGLVATTNPFGALKWKDDYSPSLQGRNVIIIPDQVDDQHPTDPGPEHAEQVYKSVYPHATTVRILNLDKHDVSDWFDAGHTAAELVELAASVKKAENPNPIEETALQKLFRPADDLATLPLSEWLIKPILLENTTAFLVGDTGTWKSFISLNWSMFLGQEQPVMYIAGEGNFTTRVEAWKRHYGKTGGKVYFSKFSLQPGNIEHQPLILKAVEELRPVLVVIDTLNRAAIGLNENDQSDMGKFLDACDKIRLVNGACVLIVHHTNRGGSERGSSALKDGADTFIKATKEGDIVKLTCEKQKDRPDFEPLYWRSEIITLPDLVYSDGEQATSLVVLPVDTASIESPNPSAPLMGNQKEVLTALAAELFAETGATTKRLQDFMGGKWASEAGRNAITRALNTLLKKKYAVQGRKGEPYKITQAGLDVVSQQEL